MTFPLKLCLWTITRFIERLLRQRITLWSISDWATFSIAGQKQRSRPHRASRTLICIALTTLPSSGFILGVSHLNSSLYAFPVGCNVVRNSIKKRWACSLSRMTDFSDANFDFCAFHFVEDSLWKIFQFFKEVIKIFDIKNYWLLISSFFRFVRFFGRFIDQKIINKTLELYFFVL